mmetsp:Transcript_15771/g.29062  ORF Transcript_15771/g.29062 Transcript_15771/m.29062 type:complete len:430 (+) Transcript_15771:112-1401(+)
MQQEVSVEQKQSKIHTIDDQRKLGENKGSQPGLSRNTTATSEAGAQPDLSRNTTDSSACTSSDELRGDEQEYIIVDSTNNEVMDESVPPPPAPPPGLDLRNAWKPEESVSEFVCTAILRKASGDTSIPMKLNYTMGISEISLDVKPQWTVELTKTKTAAPAKGSKEEEDQAPVTTAKAEMITYDNWQRLEKYFTLEKTYEDGTKEYRYACKSGDRHCKFGGCAAKHRCKWLVAQQRKANGQVSGDTDMDKCGWCHEDACLSMLPDRLWPQQRRRRDKQQKHNEAQAYPDKRQEDKASPAVLTAPPCSTKLTPISIGQSLSAAPRKEVQEEKVDVCICGHTFESHAKFCLECGRQRLAKASMQQPFAMYNGAYPPPPAMKLMPPASPWYQPMEWNSAQDYAQAQQWAGYAQEPMYLNSLEPMKIHSSLGQ